MPSSPCCWPRCAAREAGPARSPARRPRWRAGCTARWRVRRPAGAGRRCGCPRRGIGSSSPQRSGPCRRLRAPGPMLWSARWRWHRPPPTGRATLGRFRHRRRAGAPACGRRANGRRPATMPPSRARAPRRGPAPQARARPRWRHARQPRARNPPHRTPPPATAQSPARRPATPSSIRAGTHRAPPRSGAPYRPPGSPARAAPGRTGRFRPSRLAAAGGVSASIRRRKF